MVLHITSVHIPYAAPRFHHIGRVNDAIVKRHHNRRCLEHRTGFKQIAYSIVFHFSVHTVGTLSHIDYCLDVSRCHFHDYSNTDIAIDFLQFVKHGSLCQILHVHVYGSHDVGAIDRWRIHDIKEFVEHLASVNNTIVSAQE